MAWFWSRSRKADTFTERDPSNDFWYGPVSAPVAAGVRVDTATAITNPVVFACLKVLKESIGTLPWAFFERTGERDKRRFDQHPLARVFSDPGDNRTPVEFVEQMIWDLGSEGNAYYEIADGPRGAIDRLYRMDPQMVTAERLSDRSKRYRYREKGLPERILTEDQVWHIAVPPLIDNLVGLSPIHAGREAIGAALAQADYSARFFRNDATPPFVLKHPGHFKDAEDKRNYLNAFKRWAGGKNRHNPAVLEYGIDVEKLGATNEQSQFLETRKEQALDIARIWRMPPHKVGILDKATFSNIEQQSLEFVIDTLLPWIRLVEKSVTHHLILAPDRFFFEFNVAGLLRGDIKARYEAYAVGRNWGWLSVNEIRALENQNGIGPEGDVYLQPLNMQQAGTPPADNQQRQPNGRMNGSAADHPALN